MKAVEAYAGRPYDTHYAFGDDALYCSELILRAFQKTHGRDLGQVVALGDLNWRPYECVIRRIEGGALPLKRKMITPVALSKASQVEEISAY